MACTRGARLWTTPAGRLRYLSFCLSVSRDVYSCACDSVINHLPLENRNMARIRIQDENREISDTAEISAFLAPFGIWYEKWPVESRIGPDASSEEILAAY